MDITTTPTSTASVVKTPEAEAETPASRIQNQPIKPLTFTNGVLKRHHPLNHHLPPPPPPPVVVVTYKECLKNHAATMGGHAVDGCGEFMPSPAAVPTDPTSLKCAACGCHRNFHRRDPEEPIPPPPTNTNSSAQHVIEYQPHHRHHPPPPPPPPPPRGGDISPNSPSPPPISSSYYPSAPHMLLALSSGLPETNPANSTALISPNSNGRKRFRTRFTQDQKSRMHEFAEKVGWKFQKRDEETISEFCSQVGVDRVVLKVWMHNNKNTLGKKLDHHVNNGTDNNSTLINNTTIIATEHHHHNNNHHHRENLNHNHRNNDSVSENVAATNGSSSSS